MTFGKRAKTGQRSNLTDCQVGTYDSQDGKYNGGAACDESCDFLGGWCDGSCDE